MKPAPEEAGPCSSSSVTPFSLGCDLRRIVKRNILCPACDHARQYSSARMDPSWELRGDLVNAMCKKLYQSPCAAFKREISNSVPLVLVEIQRQVLRVHGSIDLGNV